jgi:glycosyltransferase involved in cell wall biosynthesis
VLDVVIPTRNDAATLPALLAALPTRAIRSVVVVDRASKDRSVELARDSGALVLREPSGGYGAACLRAQAHLSSLPRGPVAVAFFPGYHPAAAAALALLIAPIAERGVELVLGAEDGRRDMGERVVTGLIDAVYRHRWSSVGPVRALRFPALIALGMSDRGDGWDVEMLVRAVKLGLSCDEIAVPVDERRGPKKSLGRALLHILRHATMR